MISELVTFDRPEGITRAEVVAGMREIAPRWRANPDLIRKTILYDPERGQAGALYPWRRKADAERFEQGLAVRALELAELFAPGTLAQARV